jgi:hypothetical protein
MTEDALKCDVLLVEDDVALSETYGLLTCPGFLGPG